MAERDAWQHIPVLLHEAVDALAIVPDGTYVDGTFGRGGHTRGILARLSSDGRLFSFDKDPQAIAHARASIVDARFEAIHADFASMASALHARGVSSVHGVLLDLGVSSPQIDDATRGFSFRVDAPLDMRMDPMRGESAADFLARADAKLIADVIRSFGEERFAVPIAKAVVARRDDGRPVRTTRELAELVARAVRTREGGQDPATRTFQALRIHVNGELEAAAAGLEAATLMLRARGRLAVISFHSLEDRIVKQFIAHESREDVDRRAPFAPPTRALRLRALARVKPSDAEVAANPRSRSAVLRVAERLGDAVAAAPAAAPRGSRRAGRTS
jgi:16S rRNA (cytosine1402-N4)-methyltransferase